MLNLQRCKGGKKVLAMTEYIEREALMRHIKEIHCAECNSYNGVRCRACWVDDTLDYIDCYPAADVATVRHGRWICIRKGYGEYECSVCHGEDSDCSDYYGTHVVTEQDFCPNCGAKMDLEDV